MGVMALLDNLANDCKAQQQEAKSPPQQRGAGRLPSAKTLTGGLPIRLGGGSGVFSAFGVVFHTRVGVNGFARTTMGPQSEDEFALPADISSPH